MRTKLYGEITADLYIPRDDQRPSLFVPAGVSAAWLASAATLLDDHLVLDRVAREAIAQRLVDGDAIVADYFRFHREELGLVAEPEQLALIGFGIRTSTLVLDYSLSTSELLVIAFDAGQRVVAITHES